MDMKQLELWLRPGVLGFYQSCEVTVCGLLDHGGKAHNIFTIFSFEDRKADLRKPAFLTEKNERFGGGFRLLAVQYHISLDAAAAAFREITERGERITTPLGPLETAALVPIPACFVPNDSTLTIPMNALLKNNFRGSMAAEWYGDRSDILQMLKEDELQRAALRIRELLPIDLFALSDHVGNILFQFPQQIVFCKLSGTKTAVTCSIVWDDRVPVNERYSLSVSTAHDETLMDYHEVSGTPGTALALSVSNTGGPYVITLTNTEHGIPILRQTTSMVRQVHSILELKGDADAVRTIALKGGAPEQITINSAEEVSMGIPPLPWEEAARQRQYQKRMKELMRRLEFVRYGCSGNERIKALGDLRKLMNLEPPARACLWDPYLTADDLLETWYFTDTYGKELRAITSCAALKEPGQEKQTLYDWMARQRETLSMGSNQFGINLRWRIQHGRYGFPFHDRFLILIPKEGPPKVWSMGTSVNGFGKKHHILQQVANPRYILDDFEMLWAALEDDSCQIWNSEEVWR